VRSILAGKFLNLEKGRHGKGGRMKFKKCPQCGGDSFTELAKCETLQKGVRLDEESGVVESSYDDAGTVDLLDQYEVTGYTCDVCGAEYHPEFGGHTPSPVRVVIGMEGGLVTSVTADRPVEVLVLDYDLHDLDEDRISVIDGEECCAGQFSADLNPDVVARCYADLAAHAAAAESEGAPHAGRCSC
jgi:hypothetical protein